MFLEFCSFLFYGGVTVYPFYLMTNLWLCAGLNVNKAGINIFIFADTFVFLLGKYL